MKEIETLFSNQPKSTGAGKSGDKKKAAGSKSDVVHLVIDIQRLSSLSPSLVDLYLYHINYFF